MTILCRIFGCRYIATQHNDAIPGVNVFHVRFTFKCKRCGSTTISGKKKFKIAFKWRT